MTVLGSFGGFAGQTGGARLVVQPVDAVGGVLGEPIILGPPPPDRKPQDQTAMLHCFVYETFPVATRFLAVQLQAVGQGGIARARGLRHEAAAARDLPSAHFRLRSQ